MLSLNLSPIQKVRGMSEKEVRDYFNSKQRNIRDFEIDAKVAGHSKDDLVAQWNQLFQGGEGKYDGQLSTAKEK